MKVETKSAVNKYHSLRTVHQLQKSIVRQNMHNAMSPISAISGYLELISLSLFQDKDVERIERYRKKIECGIKELNNIFEQLQGIYDEDYSDEAGDIFTSVEINWFVRELCDLMRSPAIKLAMITSIRPIHVLTDLFKTKLIISNFINYAEKSAHDGKVEVETNKVDDMAAVIVRFGIKGERKEELRNLLDSEGMDKTDVLDSFSRGLLTCTKLAEQIDGCVIINDKIEGSVEFSLLLPLSTSH